MFRHVPNLLTGSRLLLAAVFFVMLSYYQYEGRGDPWFLNVAFFIYLMWRERREEISTWPGRARVVFYGAALLAVADLGVDWYGGAHGLQIIAFVGVLALAGLAMWRTWRDQHTY